MDDVAARPSLYDQDFYAWTQAQAELLRHGRLDEADIANLLEEVESSGKSLVAELRSRLKVLAQHLLKEIYQPEKASRSWATTIFNQRDEIALLILENPSLKPKVDGLFRRSYSSARKATSLETGIAAKILPLAPPFTCAQALDDDFWPGRSVDDRD